MEPVVLFAAAAFLVLGLVGGLLLNQLLVPGGRRGSPMAAGTPTEEGESGVAESTAAVAAAIDSLREEQARQLQTMVETTLNVASSKLGDQLAAGKHVIDRERLAVSEQVANVNNELQRVAGLVSGLQQQRAEQDGRLVERLERTVAETSRLADTTTSLRDALASPKSRGQWGERMAEDVLQVAGFIEGVNYQRQQGVAGGGIPDYTFSLPKGHQVHMDVKFPADNYLRWLEAERDDERDSYQKQFRRDVRQRVKELTERRYIDPEYTVDYMLLFIPNESIYGFVHEHDPELIDMALGHKVILCSPTSLFAVLAVVRQAVDNFLVERKSAEILASISGLREQWDKFGGTVDKMGRGLQSAQKAYDELAGTRSRQFEKQIEKLEAVRAERGSEEAAAELGPVTQPGTAASGSDQAPASDDGHERHWLALAQ